MATKPKKSARAGANDVAAEQQGAVNGADSQDDTQSTNRLASEAEAATEAREVAEQAKQKADEELTAAEQALAAADAKLEAGDDAMTATAYAKIQFTVKQARGLVAKAERELIAAQQAERVAVAIAAASELIDGSASREGQEAAVEAAQVAVSEALSQVVETVQHRNSVLRSAIARARQAGLNDSDPFSPVRLGTHRDQPWQKGTPVLIVGDEEALEADPTDVALEALSAAVKASGLALRVEKVGGGK